MKKLGIQYIDYYIPNNELLISDFINKISIEDIPKSFSDKEEYKLFVDEILRLKSIRIEPKMKQTDMFSILINKALESDEFQKEEIDLIVICQEEDKISDTNQGQFIQHKYGFDKAHVLNISGNYCTNLEVTLNLLTKLSEDSGYKKILVLSAKKTYELKNRIYGSFALVGDSAGLIIVSNDINIQIIDTEILSCSQFHSENFLVSEKDNSLIFGKYFNKCIQNLLKRNSLVDKDIDKIIIQNGNPLLITHCIEQQLLNTEKIFNENFGKYGHFDQIDYLINLKDCKKECPNISGYVLTLGSGYAGAFVASLLSY